MISGIFANCIGTTNLEAMLKFWTELGYREVDRGQLATAQASHLHGYESALTSVRLQNGQITTNGLIRVFACFEECWTVTQKLCQTLIQKLEFAFWESLL